MGPLLLSFLKVHKTTANCVEGWHGSSKENFRATRNLFVKSLCFCLANQENYFALFFFKIFFFFIISIRFINVFCCCFLVFIGGCELSFIPFPPYDVFFFFFFFL